MNGRRIAAVAAVTLAVALAACAPPDQNGDTVTVPSVVPAPAALEASGAAPFALTAATSVTGDPDAVSALAGLIGARTGMTPAGTGPAIELRIDPSTDSGTEAAAESYRIVAGEASVAVTGADAAGLFYGVQTLGQLISRDGEGWSIPAVRIDDAPRFAYRGVMLDVARHFHGVDTVKAYIDRAVTLKFNALHLHLSDDQAWRLHLDSRPELTAVTAGNAIGGDPGGFFTKSDYAELVAYASARHMIVVPEFDTPGHTHAVGLAYPELVEAPVLSEHIAEVVRVYGGDLPTAGEPYQGMAVGFSSLRIHDEATYDFLADVFGELAAMTPGPYLHVGGDEALGTDPADFAHFMERVTTLVERLGKTPVAWHEAGSAPGLAPTTVGQYWGFVTPTDGMDDKARAFVAHGAGLILSPADAIYLDMKHSADSPLGLTWANGVTSVERAYAWEPSDVIAGIDDADILGVEAPMWTETIRDLGDIDEMAFPRIAAAAEAGWSPATGTGGLRTWESFRTRVGALGPLWTSLGIAFHPSTEIPWEHE
ncbi:beta-N-acetylhexosaminidase [Microbacterium sp. RU33B]|uniref:beta-N-acetylhexosaminidase n=1 Tax=Microbacterium sp. RU33B TaxID=1907390 RepID=UPI00095AFBA9|nr:beta-N-acetylhexosaminidase [Microbacterium sp. RU33B]SIT88276.1 hexosaminidase [Microbacterium sp. RU33B]